MATLDLTRTELGKGGRPTAVRKTEKPYRDTDRHRRSEGHPPPAARGEHRQRREAERQGLIADQRRQDNRHGQRPDEPCQLDWRQGLGGT